MFGTVYYGFMKYQSAEFGLYVEKQKWAASAQFKKKNRGMNIGMMIMY